MKSKSLIDEELVLAAQNVIRQNYDDIKFNHTVGAAIRCSNGKIYTGVNLYSIHGACAEQIALANAITNGEREFKTIVAVRGKNGEEILTPCGNCRQILMDYAPECEVIIANDKAFKITELIPFAYKVEC